MNQEYQQLIDQVSTAFEENRALNITGGNSKLFYGGEPVGEPLDLSQNQGIVEYDPAELVMVARTGTPLLEIQSALHKNNQMLGFEPPFAKTSATIGGVIASGLSGSGRPYRGGVRDFLLGTKIINGRAEVLQFGGRVMKNVAGFDLFRPMAGAMGTLGVLLEGSLRVIPMPEYETSIRFEQEAQADAIQLMSRYGQALASISAAAWYAGRMSIRLSGSELAVKRDLGILNEQGKLNEIDDAVWQQLSHFDHDFFKLEKEGEHIISIDVPAATRPIELPGVQLIEWGGARRYLRTCSSLEEIRTLAQAVGGHVNCINRADRAGFFAPLSSSMLALHQQVKQTFDPAGILNPGRLYPAL